MTWRTHAVVWGVDQMATLVKEARRFQRAPIQAYRPLLQRRRQRQRITKTITVLLAHLATIADYWLKG
jgi:hypothetical protein